MGIYVDYVLRAEGTEAEVRERLERVRARCLDLPLRTVGDVLRVAPIYNIMVLSLFEKLGHTLPAAVAAPYHQAEEDRDHGVQGMLLEGHDNCGYYASRSWKDASKRVNEELSFAGLMGRLMGVAIGNIREEGTPVRVIEDNASKAKPVDFSAALAREQERAKCDDAAPAAEGGEETSPH
jgi:hypothetical protein